MTTTASDAFRAPLQAKFDLHVRAFQARDGSLITRHFFAPDALWEFQPYPSMQGREQIGVFFDKVVNESTVRIELLDAGGHDTVRWTRARYHVDLLDQAAPSWTYHALFNWSLHGDEWLVDACMGLIPSAAAPGG